MHTSYENVFKSYVDNIEFRDKHNLDPLYT